MAKIKAFKAIRPSRDKAHLVVTRPVSTYSKTVLKGKLESNPFSFIHIIHPEFNSTNPKTTPNSKERFQTVRKKYEEFIHEKILFKDQEDHIYLYKQTTPSNTFLGVIAGASVQEYLEDSIKKHEATLTKREEMFTNYLEIVGYNAEPVLLSYPHSPELEGIYERIIQSRPEYEFSTTDRIKHELWVIDSENEQLIASEFKKIDAIYIADGHHRSASSCKLALRNKDNKLSKEINDYFLAFFMDEKRLNILEFNRLVHTLNNLSDEDFLQKLKVNFEIEELKIGEKPKREHQITMNLHSKWYSLSCKNHILTHTNPVSCLDPEIVTNYILQPILGIQDLKTDNRISFIPGNLGLDAINMPIMENKSDVGFILFPLTFEQVVKVADKQMIMPPKSTWVEPKLRSGLTIFELEK
jgi:uncharacterized protein (DUF1015 family)